MENMFVYVQERVSENKCWPSERYARVLDYITERLPYQIDVCGGKDDQYISACIMKKNEEFRYCS